MKGMGDAPVSVRECCVTRRKTYCVERRKMLYLQVATLKLAVELRDNLVGQHLLAAVVVVSRCVMMAEG
jgi:hypothetical protein